MEVRTFGIDLGKSTFHLVGMDDRGRVIEKKCLSRPQLLLYTVNKPPCLIGMEACCGAHVLGRALAAQGHQVRLIPAQFVKPFVKSNKNDFIDAEAIAEAVQRPQMRFVPVKTEDQLDLQALHRVRDRLVSRRTSVINQIRAFLLERGITFRQGRRHLKSRMPFILEDAEVSLTPRMRSLIDALWQEWKAVELSIDDFTKQIEAIARQDNKCQRLVSVPGIGPLVSTAMIAAIGNGHAFAKGREFAAWLGLTPKQHSTGGRSKLLGISKRGNPYLRRLFIHGARSVFLHLNRQEHAIGRWMSDLETRVHRNVAVVAIANKLARIAWTVLTRGELYRETTHSQAVTV